MPDLDLIKQAEQGTRDRRHPGARQAGAGNKATLAAAVRRQREFDRSLAAGPARGVRAKQHRNRVAGECELGSPKLSVGICHPAAAPFRCRLAQRSIPARVRRAN
jgi:hypothetical protein